MLQLTNETKLTQWKNNAAGSGKVAGCSCFLAVEFLRMVFLLQNNPSFKNETSKSIAVGQ